jgi:CheY-like chemotaxis protein
MTAASATLARTVLVVDDERVVRMVLDRYFGRQGWTVLEAETAEGALALLDGAPEPDLVLCDLNLPGLSGAALCRRITEKHPVLATRLVLTSGDPTSAAAELQRASLHCPVLGKPFTLADLERIVNTVARAA